MTSIIHSHLSARDAEAGKGRAKLTKAQVGDAAIRDLNRMGIRIPAEIVRQQVDHQMQLQARIGDAALPGLQATVPSVSTPLQFLQNWLPGFVNAITAARMIDKIAGITTMGNWHDEEIVQGYMELTGDVSEYSDYNNVSLASWNNNWERRTIVRGQIGIEVRRLEEERAAAMRVNSADQKRNSASLQLEKFRNSIGFFGYFNGRNRTYGLMNDPNLPDYVASVTTGWATATMVQIVADLRNAIRLLRVNSGGVIDPVEDELTLVLPLAYVEYMTVITDFGISVAGWLKQTFPKLRYIGAPEMAYGAVAGQPGSVNVFYLFAERIDSAQDGSTDGGETLMQLVQTKFVTTGVEQKITGYAEGYTNATAGVLVKRPYAVVRVFGI